MVDQLLVLRESVGSDVAFIVINLAVAAILSIWLIPWSTDLMVNSAAGLTAKYLGNRWRTLVINCSTNNPEAVTMLVSLVVLRQTGGIGTPLGSNLANIYLIYIVAFGFVLVRSRLLRLQQFRGVIATTYRERTLVIWHVTLAVALFAMAILAYYLLTGQLPIQLENDDLGPFQPTLVKLLFASLVSCLGVVAYIYLDSLAQRRRPELYEEIDDSAHNTSWPKFALGTAMLLASCYVVNSMFEAADRLYAQQLSVVFGQAVFAALHYFLGALVTSLPEMHVAIKNYERATSPDFNTALAAASASNMCNLGIAGIGCLIAALFFV